MQQGSKCSIGRNMEQTVEAKAKRERDGVWTLTVKCPYCGKQHMHGGGDGKRPFYGHRLSHCLKVPVEGYELVPESQGT